MTRLSADNNLIQRITANTAADPTFSKSAGSIITVNPPSDSGVTLDSTFEKGAVIRVLNKSTTRYVNLRSANANLIVHLPPGASATVVPLIESPTAVGDWESLDTIKSDTITYTPTVTGPKSDTTYTVRTATWRREGGYMIIDLKLVINAIGAGSNANLGVNIPSSPAVSIDTARKPNFAAAPGNCVESSLLANIGSGALAYTVVASIEDANTVLFYASGYVDGLTSTIPTTWVNGDAIRGCFKVPIAGWTERAG